jgi:hypothetical protein
MLLHPLSLCYPLSLSVPPPSFSAQGTKDVNVAILLEASHCFLLACVCVPLHTHTRNTHTHATHTHTHTQTPGVLALTDARGGVRVRKIRGHVACVEAAKRPREQAFKSQRQHACFLRHERKRPVKSTAFQLTKSRCNHGRVSRGKHRNLSIGT